MLVNGCTSMICKESGDIPPKDFFRVQPFEIESGTVCG